MGCHMKIVYLVVCLMSIVQLNHSLPLHVEDSNNILPTGIVFSTAVYDGLDSIYILGGMYSIGGRAQVYKYSIKQNTVENLGDMGWYTEASGVWTGPNEIYYIGTDLEVGNGLSGFWRLDPTNFDSRVSMHNLTKEIYNNVAVWDGEEFIYSFGGWYTGDTTYKYSKKTNTFAEYNNILTGRLHSSAVWDDVQNKAYIFGGYTDGRGNLKAREDLDEILEFDPVTNTATKLNISLTSRARGSCAIWDGTSAYILGGEHANTSSRFTPSTKTIEPIELDITDTLYYHSCVWVENLNRIYIFGGGSYQHGNRIAYIDLVEEETTTTPPSQGANLCEDEENGVLFPDPECCRSYFLCFDHVSLLQNCPSQMQFNPMLKKCEDKAVVNCGLFYYHL